MFRKLVQSRLLLLVLAGLFVANATAATREEERVADATDVLDQFLRIPEQNIPPSLLARAYAIAVIPNVVKAALVVGARYGKGILVVRQGEDTWSNPAFITVAGGSAGWQIGAQSTDIVLVFKTRKGVDGIANGKLTLGADASVAAGPVGRSTGVATDIQFNAEVVSYSRNRGLFAGVSLDGSGVSMDDAANAAFYGSPSITSDKILNGKPFAAPDVATQFVDLLTRQTRRLPTQPGMDAGAPPVGQEDKPATDTGAKTYGMPDHN